MHLLCRAARLRPARRPRLETASRAQYSHCVGAGLVFLVAFNEADASTSIHGRAGVGARGGDEEDDGRGGREEDQKQGEEQGRNMTENEDEEKD